MTPERALFLVTAWATHAAVGYALVRAFTDATPVGGAVLALVPDIDFLLPAAWGYPFVHRGITHAPVVALAAVALAYGLGRKRAAGAAGLAVGSHLAIDSLSPMGIAWLFPFGAQTGAGIAVHGPLVTVLLWVGVAALVTRGERGRTHPTAADRSLE